MHGCCVTCLHGNRAFRKQFLQSSKPQRVIKTRSKVALTYFLLIIRFSIFFFIKISNRLDSLLNSHFRNGFAESGRTVSKQDNKEVGSWLSDNKYFSVWEKIRFFWPCLDFIGPLVTVMFYCERKLNLNFSTCRLSKSTQTLQNPDCQQHLCRLWAQSWQQSWTKTWIKWMWSWKQRNQC